MDPTIRRSGRALRAVVATVLLGALFVSWGCAALGGGPGPAPVDDVDPEEVRAAEARARAAADAALRDVRAAAEAGDTVVALRRLLAASPEPVPTTAESLDLARSLTAPLDGEALGQVLQAVPLGTPLAVPVQVAYARVLSLGGDDEAARRFARAALEAGALGEEAEVARAIVDGRPLPGVPTARLGALLPLSGSPGLQRFAREIRDGMEAAIFASPLGPEGVELRVLDTGGDPAASANLLRTLDEGGAVAVLGPLEGASLQAALGGRSGLLPLVSPTVWELPEGVSGVYSLGSDDRQGPRVLAEWALSAGITQVVVLAPSRGPGSGEVGVFRRSFEEGGGSVLRALTYEPGTTFFGEQMEVIRGLRPEALLLPVPPEDVQAVAGQAAYFALDTLGVQLMGTGGWADDVVLDEMNARYLDGVVVAAPVRPDTTAEGYRRFVEAYEGRFRRTLVDPAVPALGYDAAALVLRALESGARDPESVQRALSEVRGLAGATGLLSVEDGRIVRAHRVVCFDGRRALPLGAGERPVPVYRPWAPDEANEETGELPEGPGHPDGFVCPQLAPAVAPGTGRPPFPPDSGVVAPPGPAPAPRR